VLLGVLVLGGWRLSAPSPNDSGSVTAPSPIAATPIPPSPPTPAVRTEPERVEAPIAGDKVGKTPVDVEARERFNERARAYFADAAQMTAEDRVSEAQQLEQELTRLEQAGGMSAGETLLIRAGLIRETVPSGAERDAKLQALQQRYKSETQLRLAAAQARPDPAFESYKIREREIVNEVMAMHTIPDGLSRDEYLRQRLQGAREQLTP
jgi:hypothetical protein